MKYAVSLMLLLWVGSIKAQEKDSLLFVRGNFKIYQQKALVGNSTVYDTAIDYKRILEIEEDGNAECTKGISINYNPLSLVGDYYSYSRNRYDTGGGGSCYRNPSNEVSINTINLQTLKPANILELVEESSLVKALQQDNFVRNLYGEMDTLELDKQNNLEGILKLMESILGEHNPFNNNQFAVYSFNKEKNRIAVRMVAQEYMGYNHHKLLQLGLWVKPKEKTKQLLKQEESFFLNRFQNNILPQE